MALTAHNVTFTYARGLRAVNGASLEARKGELLGIIGPNGSGKSTLLRLMAGLLRPQSGEVMLDGAPLAAMDKESLARRIAFLPQQVESVFSFTCEEVVAMGRYPHLGAFGFLSAHDEEVARESMTRTDTLQFAARLFDELSGGERQRVLIASILAQQSDHLLLDEPTSALDIQHQAEVFTLLRDSSRKGLAVAVVIHDVNLAAQYCDRMILMSIGKAIAEGSPEDVLRLEHLAPVYGGAVAVSENPLTGGPLVVVLAPHQLEKIGVPPLEAG
ncbi:MAG: heme ABC transporter ATP-binding protein [Candidatus Sumerlaeota bacterium]|nr:heme ABC transporter ATP-binding protein [Candidatus Sumerlaeota bacterium]